MKKILLVAISHLLFNCSEEQEFLPREYPFVKTLAVSNIKDDGKVTLNGEILHLGLSDVIDHGFVWSIGEDLKENYLNKQSLGEISSAGKFSFELDSGLIAGRSYFIRSFASNSVKTVFGNLIEFEAIRNSPVLPFPVDYVVYYPFDGHVMDKSGNGIHGINIGATSTSDRNDNEDRALFFHSPSMVDVGDTLDNVIAGSDKSFNFTLWIKPEKESIDKSVLIAKAGNSECGEEQRELLLNITDHKINFITYYTLPLAWFRIVQTKTELEPETWYHISINYDGNIDTSNGLDRVTIFINGIQEETFLTSGPGNLGDIQNGTAHFGIGNILDSEGKFCVFNHGFRGTIDEVKIYERNLSPLEIEMMSKE